LFYLQHGNKWYSVFTNDNLKLFFGKGDPKAIKSLDKKMAVLLNFLDPIITRKRRQHYMKLSKSFITLQIA
jgi:hypothetical protein